MFSFPIISGIILLILIIILVISIPAFRIRQEEYKRTGKHPKGYYMGQGMGIGLVLGIPIGIAMGNIAFGPGIGLAMGVAIGTAMEKKYEKDLRPLTVREEELQQRLIMLLLGLMVLGVVVGFIFYYQAAKETKPAEDMNTVTSDTVSSFEECVEAGNPVMESYPRQCRHNGITYTEEF